MWANSDISANSMQDPRNKVPAIFLDSPKIVQESKSENTFSVSASWALQEFLYQFHYASLAA